jgi:RNA polymerase sigma-70 factor (family 1)
MILITKRLKLYSMSDSGNYSTLTECLRSLKEGDQNALEVIYNKYVSPLYAYTIKHIKSKELAEEIVHDVFLKLWQSRESLRLETSFKSYLFTICRNHILNTLRRVSREAVLKDEIITAYINDYNNPETDLIFNDLLRTAQRAIKNLPPKRQLAFSLNKDEGKDYDEIALQMGISRGTVKDHLCKARKSIFGYLAENDL